MQIPFCGGGSEKRDEDTVSVDRSLGGQVWEGKKVVGGS